MRYCMKTKLYYNTVTPFLSDMLNELMNSPAFDSFRLVGGTALSLQRGHRKSANIDLFTDAKYGSVDFGKIDGHLRNTWKEVNSSGIFPPGSGISYFIGHTKDEQVKLDLFYSDPFIHPPLIIDHIRMATIEEIAAMKCDVIRRGGRKKDFWDIHELAEKLRYTEILRLHQERHPFQHDKNEITNSFLSFEKADDDFTPECLRGKYWELIKADIVEWINES